MTLLVGQTGANFTQTTLVANAAADMIWWTSGHVAVASGTATHAYVRIPGWSSSSAAKVVVYDSSRNKLATASFTSSQGTGLLSAAFDVSFSVTSGQTYYIALTPSNFVNVTTDTATAQASRRTASAYSSPPDPLPTGTADSTRMFEIYVDGTTGTSTIAWLRI